MNNTTIVISNWNYEKFVDSAIESCLNQTVPCDILVVDDASTDNSWNVIKKYVHKNSQVKGVRLSSNSDGNARGKNVGICLSETPYIVCLDADDMLLPKSLATRLKYISDVDFVHGWARHARSTKKYSHILQTLPHKKVGYTERRKTLAAQCVETPTRWSFAIEASTVIANKSLYNRLGLYDEEMRWTIDREMWWRWLFHGATRHTVDKFVSIYRKHPGQVTGDRSRKNPSACAKMLEERRELRVEINSDNTLLIPDYDHMGFVDEIIE